MIEADFHPGGTIFVILIRGKRKPAIYELILFKNNQFLRGAVNSSFIIVPPGGCVSSKKSEATYGFKRQN
jgi:hypothetical protein